MIHNLELEGRNGIIEQVKEYKLLGATIKNYENNELEVKRDLRINFGKQM